MTKEIIKLLYKNRYKILITSQVIFLVIYIFVLQDYILKLAENLNDEMDVYYYKSIFNYLPASILISFAALFVLISLRHKILNLFQNLDERWLITCLMVFLFLVQVFILIFIKTQSYSDSKKYLELADRLFTTGSYINEYGNKTAFYPVGLPALLCFLKIIFGDMLMAGRIFNIIFSLATMFFIYKVFRQFLKKNELYLFLPVFFLFPNNFFAVNPILTEQVFSFLLWSFIYLFFRKEKFLPVVGGIILGLMLYFRSYSFLILLVIFFYSFKMGLLKKYFRNILVMTVMMVMVAMPWFVRNYLTFNSIVPMTTNGGFNFLMGNHKASYGNINFDFHYNMDNSNEAEESYRTYVAGLKEIFTNPIRLIYLLPLKLIHTYKRGDVYLTWSLKKTENSLNPLLISFFFYLTNLTFYFVLFVGILKLFLIKNFSMPQKFFLYLIMSFLIICLIYVGNERYILPVLSIHFYFFSLNVNENT